MDHVQKMGRSLTGGIRFFVDQGRHAGATHISQQSSLTIGAATDNDIVLIGDQLAARHMRISVVDPWKGRVRLEAFDLPIDLTDGRRIETGHFVDLALPTRFRIGTAECRIEAVRETGGLKKFALPALGLLAAAMLLPSFGSLFSTSGTLYTPPASVTTSSASSGTNPAALSSWHDKLSEKLRLAGLTGQVSVERGSTGNLVAFGAIEDASLEKWRDVLKWYDSQGAAPLLVNNVTRGAAQTNLPAIRTVWLDSNPQVVLQNGQSVGIGDLIPGGWKIESIDSSGVLFSRDGRTAKVPF